MRTRGPSTVRVRSEDSNADRPAHANTSINDDRSRTASARRTDAWQGFVEFAETYVQLRATSCGLHDVLSGRGSRLDLEQQISRLQQAVRELVERGQQGHVIRDDLDWRDIPFALATAIPASHTIGLEPKSDQWRRNLRVVLDGLGSTFDK